MCLAKTHEIYDGKAIEHRVLPELKKLRELNRNEKVNLLILNIYNRIAKRMPIPIIGSNFLPSLIPMLTNPAITAKEYTSYISLVERLMA